MISKVKVCKSNCEDFVINAIYHKIQQLIDGISELYNLHYEINNLIDLAMEAVNTELNCDNVSNNKTSVDDKKIKRTSAYIEKEIQKIEEKSEENFKRRNSVPRKKIGRLSSLKYVIQWEEMLEQHNIDFDIPVKTEPSESEEFKPVLVPKRLTQFDPKKRKKEEISDTDNIQIDELNNNEKCENNKLEDEHAKLNKTTSVSQQSNNQPKNDTENKKGSSMIIKLSLKKYEPINIDDDNKTDNSSTNNLIFNNKSPPVFESLQLPKVLINFCQCMECRNLRKTMNDLNSCKVEKQINSHCLNVLRKSMSCESVNLLTKTQHRLSKAESCTNLAKCDNFVDLPKADDKVPVIKQSKTFNSKPKIVGVVLKKKHTVHNEIY